MGSEEQWPGWQEENEALKDWVVRHKDHNMKKTLSYREHPKEGLEDQEGAGEA